MTSLNDGADLVGDFSSLKVSSSPLTSSANATNTAPLTSSPPRTTLHAHNTNGTEPGLAADASRALSAATATATTRNGDLPIASKGMEDAAATLAAVRLASVDAEAQAMRIKRDAVSAASGLVEDPPLPIPASAAAAAAPYSKKEVEEAEEDSSEISASDEDGSWISWFCSLRGNEFFCEVDEDYIQDDFNLTGLNLVVPYYDYALDMVLDIEMPMEDTLNETQQEIVESAAVSPLVAHVAPFLFSSWI